MNVVNTLDPFYNLLRRIEETIANPRFKEELTKTQQIDIRQNFSEQLDAIADASLCINCAPGSCKELISQIENARKIFQTALLPGMTEREEREMPNRMANTIEKLQLYMRSFIT